MADNFAAGEMDAESGAPPIETIGARYGIREMMPMPAGRGEHEHLTVPYVMQSVHARNGSMERTMPGIVQTPLGGLMPGPYAIAPAVMAGHVGAFPLAEDDGGFNSGVIDGYPEGPPIPFRV